MSVDYCGGIPEISKVCPVEIVVFPDSIEIIRAFSKNIKILFKNIKNVSIKTDEQISKDVTLTRLLLLGVLAFGAKKKTNITTNYLLIDYVADGIDCTAIFTGKSIPKISSKIAKARQKYIAANPPKTEKTETLKNDDVCSEIEKFYNLKEKGIITEEEFTAKKNQLLGL